MKKPKSLITGAASGIGQATALRFVEEGYEVCVTDINEQGLAEVYQSLPDGQHLMVSGDFTSAQTIDELHRHISNEWGGLDVLVNCAGVSSKSDPVSSTLENFRSTFDILVNGCIRMTALSVHLMKEGGRIIHITSVHGTHAEAGASSYAMGKAAIDQFCRSMAVELADKNILVNAIAPGFVDTPMSIVEGTNELETEWFRDNYIRSHHLPLRRAAKAEEIAGVALFLAGKDASYITGQVIVVDGGLTITF